MNRSNSSGGGFKLGDVFNFKRAKNQFHSSASTSGSMIGPVFSQNSRSQPSQDVFNYSNSANSFEHQAHYDQHAASFHGNSQSNPPPTFTSHYGPQTKHDPPPNDLGVHYAPNNLQAANSVTNFKPKGNCQDAISLGDFLEVKSLLEALNSRLVRLESDVKMLNHNSERANDFCARGLDKLNTQFLNLTQIGEGSRDEICSKIDESSKRTSELFKSEYTNMSTSLCDKINNELKNNDICKKDLETTQTIAKYVTTTLESLEKCTSKWQNSLDKFKTENSLKRNTEKVEKTFKAIDDLRKKFSSHLEKGTSTYDKRSNELKDEIKQILREMAKDIKKSFKHSINRPAKTQANSQDFNECQQIENQAQCEPKIVPPTPKIKFMKKIPILSKDSQNVGKREIKESILKPAESLVAKVSKKEETRNHNTIPGFSRINRKSSKSANRRLIDFNPDFSKKLLQELLTGREE